jgi:hypothetical protein
MSTGSSLSGSASSRHQRFFDAGASSVSGKAPRKKKPTVRFADHADQESDDCRSDDDGLTSTFPLSVIHEAHEEEESSF